jgi:hypothetical protein
MGVLPPWLRTWRVAESDPVPRRWLFLQGLVGRRWLFLQVREVIEIIFFSSSSTAAAVKHFPVVQCGVHCAR